MENNSLAILALVLLVVVGFVVIIGLSYNPTPIHVESESNCTAEDILNDRTNQQKNKSNCSPQREEIRTPSSIESDIYDYLKVVRQERDRKLHFKDNENNCRDD